MAPPPLPPRAATEFPVRVQWLSVSVPWLKTPPLPAGLELWSFSLKPPVMVWPAIVTVAPASITKTRLLPAALTVTPAAGPVSCVLVDISGRAVSFSVMVWAVAKTVASKPIVESGVGVGLGDAVAQVAGGAGAGASVGQRVDGVRRRQETIFQHLQQRPPAPSLPCRFFGEFSFTR
jgi:hypothetical protein